MQNTQFSRIFTMFIILRVEELIHRLPTSVLFHPFVKSRVWGKKKKKTTLFPYLSVSHQVLSKSAIFVMTHLPTMHIIRESVCVCVWSLTGINTRALPLHLWTSVWILVRRGSRGVWLSAGACFPPTATTSDGI